MAQKKNFEEEKKGGVASVSLNQILSQKKKKR